MKRVFITGASGLIGRRLVRRLVERGDEVTVLTRDRKHTEVFSDLGERVGIMKGDPGTFAIWREAAGESDAIVNLAGEPVFGPRWDDEVKAKISESRLMATRNVVAAVGLVPAAKRAKVLINASAIGYYGFDRGDEVLDEGARPGEDFLARLCVGWEEIARGAAAHGVRPVVLRIGIVLAPEGGALAQMVTPFKFFMGGPIGDGLQWFSWIHIDDVVGLILHAIDTPSLRGPMNAVAPDALRMTDFCKALGRALRRPSWLSVPKSILRLRFGEVADILAGSQHVVPGVAESSGYKFLYPTADDALGEIFGRKKKKGGGGGEAPKPAEAAAETPGNP